MTHIASWKRTERRVAAMLGGVRVPVTGRARGSAPDIAHPLYALEVKHTGRLPRMIENALRQAEASVRGEQIPVAVIHGAGDDLTRALVVLRLGDFADHFGGPA